MTNRNAIINFLMPFWIVPLYIFAFILMLLVMYKVDSFGEETIP